MVHKWRVVGKSVTGAAHTRVGKPRQDDLLWWPKVRQDAPLILAVADGHGSSKSFRSAQGAKSAVRMALATLREFLRGQPDLSNFSAVKRTAEDALPKELVRHWREEVTRNLSIFPFTADEWATLEKNGEPGAREAVEKNPHLAYGATLLTVLVADQFIVYLQLGDGDILAVSETGEVERPMPKDERLFANETTSLCAPKAWQDFRLSFQALSGAPPALILLATDGYANSFRDDASFVKVGKDLLDIIRTDNLDHVDENLETWLAEASQAGSGDDVTVGLVCRMDAVEVAKEPV